MALVLTRLVRSNYDELDNIPIIHQDLTASFTKQADTYYIHTGSTTSAYTKGRMYYCDGTNLKKVVIVDELPKVNDGKLTITVNGTTHTFTANQSGNTSFSITDTTYTAGTGVNLLNGVFSVKTGYSTNGKNYKVTTDTSGNLYVNVPWTDTNTDTHYTNYLQIKGNNTEAVKFTQNADKTLNFKPGANVSISAVSGEITISSTDTNTATAADNILDGSNSGTQITYAPYTSQQSKLSFDTSTTNPTRTDRLNLNGYLYATKLYSGGKEVFTSHQSIKSINTNNTTAQAVANETVAGSGTINLHKVSKTGSYNDLLNRPTKLSDFTDDKVVKFTNTTVAASAFVADNNYSNYGYCASIGLSGVTANDTADIYFSGKQVEQEIYASFCESYAGGVKIYAAEKPSEAVIIPLILIHK